MKPGIVVATLLSISVGAWAGMDAEPIKPASLPPAVAEAIARDFSGRTVATVVRDERNDFVYFRVSFSDDREPRSVTFRETGEKMEPPPRTEAP